MTIEEKLEHFKEYAMDEARSQSAIQLDQYESAQKKLLKEHEEKKHRQEKFQLKSETEQIIRENNQKLSQEQIEIRRVVREKTEALKDKLFIEVRQLLDEYKKTPEYEALLEQQLKEALDFAAGEAITLYIDPSDEDKKEALEEKINAQLTISNYSFDGGMRAVIPERSILIDNSFETKLAEERENFVMKGGAV